MTTLLLADDHPLFRAGLRAVVEADPRIVVSEAGTTTAALALAKSMAFDIALIDVVLPEHGGAMLVRALGAIQPSCHVLALSMIDDPIRVAEMLRAGALGYALKSEPVQQIVAGIATVLAGKRYLSPQLPADEVARLIAIENLPLEALTVRERDVFTLLVRGDSNANVARQLAIAQSTVETHRRHIMRKLAADSIVDLIRLAVRHGVLTGFPRPIVVDAT